MSFRPAIALCAIVLAVGCTDSGPATVRIFGLDPQTRQYGEFDAHLGTLDDVTQMRGDAVTFVGGATIVADVLAASNDPKGNRILRAEGGGAPTCSYTNVDGVLHAEDYDSYNMASAYYALETSRQLFIDLGVDPGGLNALNAYYHPRVQMGTKLIPTFWLMIDNAAYAPPFDGFLIVPHVMMEGVPFTANLGVMAHEYGHKVFNRIVERGANVQAWLMHDWSASATKQIRGVDEAMSDIFGFLATGDTDYIAPSIEGLDIDLGRDLAERREMTADYAAVLLFDGDGGPNGEAYDPHELGAFVASALWRFGEDLVDHRRVALAVLEVERDLGEAIAASPTYDFSSIEFLDRFASKFMGSERQLLCGIYQDRFSELIAADTGHALESCP